MIALISGAGSALLLGADDAGTVAEESVGLGVYIALVASLGLVVLNGFYVAYEFALLAARRSSFEGSNGGRNIVNEAARASLSDLSMQLAGAQLGITIASLALGRIGEPALEVFLEPVLGDRFSHDVAHGLAIAISLAIFTFLHLIFGEMVPKNIALAAPEGTLRWLVLPYRFYLFLFRPIVRLLNELANLGCRAVGIEPRDELLTVHTVSELTAIVSHSSEGGAIEADEAQLLQGALEFARRPVAEIAMPISEVVSVPLGATALQLERVVASSGQDRILVVDPGRYTTPIGYLHAKDLLEVEPSRRADPVPGSLVRKMAVVGGQRSLVETLRLMRRAGRQLAVVSASEGESAVVSVEEVVRALIGDSQ